MTAFLPSAEHAQGNTLVEEYNRQIKSAQVITALGDDLFGERVNLYTGSTEFVVTDVALRGNDKLPVALGRRYIVQPWLPLGSHAYHPFGDWDFDIPHLQGIFRGTWTTRAGNRRCNVSGYEAVPPTEYWQGGTFDGVEYWNGNHLYVPGEGTQEMLLLESNPNLPTDGATYKWVTQSNWYFSCNPNADGTSDTFIGLAPDGTRYWFNWMAARPYPALQKGYASPGFVAGRDGGTAALLPEGYSLPRQEVWAFPTRIEDRFGNFVTYTYDTTNRWQLKEIAASDGRRISLTYNTAGTVASVTAGTRTWTYGYTGDALTSVTLPDNSRWLYSLQALTSAEMETYETGPCDGVAFQDNNDPKIGTITHPSGAQGQFAFRGVVHGRSYVRRQCMQPYTGVYYARYAKEFAQFAIAQKTISGPGLTTAQWIYSYGAPNDSYADECSAGCPTTKTVEVTGPGTHWQRYTFGNRFEDTDGKLLKVETGTSGTATRVESSTYLTNPASQRYPAQIGDSPYSRSDKTAEKYSPLIRREIVQQGRKFLWEVPQVNGVYDVDRFARPTKIIRSSTPVP